MYINQHIMSKWGIASRPFEPKRGQSDANQFRTYSSSLACFAATILTRISIAQHHPPSGAGRTSARLGLAWLPERMIINFPVSCQVCGRGDIRLVFWIGNLDSVGVWFSEDKRTTECGFATSSFVLKLTF